MTFKKNLSTNPSFLSCIILTREWGCMFGIAGGMAAILHADDAVNADLRR